MTDFYTAADVISTYTRAQAIEDGDLIDISKMAKECGYSYPAAITRALYADINGIPDSQKGIESFDARLWDVLWMGKRAALVAGGNRVVFQLIMRVKGSRKNLYFVKVVLADGDEAGKPVFTFMKPNES